MRFDSGIPRHREVTPERYAQIQRELSGAPPRAPSGPQPGHEYVTTQQAMALLHVNHPGQVRELGLPGIKCGPRGTGGRGRRPWLYRRAHIERLIAVRRAVRVN